MSIEAILTFFIEKYLHFIQRMSIHQSSTELFGVQARGDMNTVVL
jgi:hypothetical protein